VNKSDNFLTAICVMLGWACFHTLVYREIWHWTVVVLALAVLFGGVGKWKP